MYAMRPMASWVAHAGKPAPSVALAARCEKGIFGLERAKIIALAFSMLQECGQQAN